jgi:hypothetical protein
VKIDYPCICGHSKINHNYIVTYPNRQIWCGVSWCECYGFKPDNLKYLENKLDN